MFDCSFKLELLFSRKMPTLRAFDFLVAASKQHQTLRINFQQHFPCKLITKVSKKWNENRYSSSNIEIQPSKLPIQSVVYVYTWNFVECDALTNIDTPNSNGSMLAIVLDSLWLLILFLYRFSHSFNIMLGQMMRLK